MSGTGGRPQGRTLGVTYRIAVIAGDGIGPEGIEAAMPVLDRAAAKHGFTLAWERLPYCADHYLKTGETLPDAAFGHLRDDVDAIFLGALGDPRVPGNEHARDILGASGSGSISTSISARCSCSTQISPRFGRI